MMLKKFAAKQLISYVNSDPEESIPKIIQNAERFLPNVEKDAKYQKIKEFALGKDSNWYKLIESLWTDIDEEVRKTLIENFFINGYLEWADKRPKLMKNMDVVFHGQFLWTQQVVAT